MTDKEYSDFEKMLKGPDLLLGPLNEWRVIVDGQLIPRLAAFREPNGNISLILDGRFGHSFPKEHARQAAWLIANALAIGEGESHIGAENKNDPFAPLSTKIECDSGDE